MKFAQMHLNGGSLNGTRILSEEAVQIMRSNQLPDAVENIGQLYPGNVFGVDFAIVNDSESYNGAPVGTHWWWGVASMRVVVAVLLCVLALEAPAVERNYYLAVEEIEWDYAPAGQNLITGKPFTTQEQVFTTLP